MSLKDNGRQVSLFLASISLFLQGLMISCVKTPQFGRTTRKLHKTLLQSITWLKVEPFADAVLVRMAMHGAVRMPSVAIDPLGAGANPRGRFLA
jgi:phosphatidylserine synthase